MNPVRMRIIQYLIFHKQGTATEIGEELSDIPKASLYRHLKILEESEFLMVVSENKKRGATEKVFELNGKMPMNQGEPSREEIQRLIQGMLLSLLTDFQKYFQKEELDPKKDMISLSSSTLLLSDEEFMEFMKQLGEVFESVIKNKPDGKRRLRRITFISSPILSGDEKGED